MRENGKNLAIKIIFFICMGFVLKAAAYGLYAKPHRIVCGLEAGGNVSLREMSVWLLTISPALLCAGNRLEQRIRLANTDMIRYGSYRKWWLTLAGQNTVEISAYAICLLCIGGWPGGKRALCSVCMLLLNVSVWTEIAYTLRVRGMQMTTAMTLVLLAVGLGLYLTPAGKSRFFPGFWGMWNYSAGCVINGYSPPVVIALQAVVLLLLKGYLYQKKTIEYFDR